MALNQQMSLFNLPTFNTGAAFKEAVHLAARRSGLSRDQIADRMNDLADRYGVRLVKGNSKRLTLDTLEKWLNPADKTRHMPVKALPIFCAVVDDPGPLEVLARPLGYRVIGDEDQRLLKWAAAYQQARAARQVMRKLEPEINTRGA